MISVNFLSRRPLFIASLSSCIKTSKSSYNLILVIVFNPCCFKRFSNLLKKLTIYWTRRGFRSTDLSYILLAPDNSAYFINSSYFIVSNSPEAASFFSGVFSSYFIFSSSYFASLLALSTVIPSSYSLENSTVVNPAI
jgi:hypothetical protein